MQKILLDTDIGNDIDDWFALGYLLSHKETELLGVTTVTGTPCRRAALADGLRSSYFRGLDHPAHNNELPRQGAVFGAYYGLAPQHPARPYLRGVTH